LARSLAGLLAALILAIVIINEIFLTAGEGVPSPFGQIIPDGIELFAMLIIFLGLLVGLKWQGIGGILIIAGMIIFHIVERKFLLNGLFGWFELTGILYLISWYLKQISKKSSV
jgi:hypothetical protein